MKRTILSLLLFHFGQSFTARCAPPPQQNQQSATSPNRPAQPQVMLAPAPMATTQLPSSEPVPADARKPDRIFRVGHSGAVEALAFSPDGQWLASGGYDRSIILWNLANGREEFRLETHKGAPPPKPPSMNKEAISLLAFNRDGTRLASMELSGVVRVWNLQTRTMLFAFNPHRVHYYGQALAYSADGKFLLVPVEKRLKDQPDISIGVFDAETGKSLRVITTKWNLLWNLVATADGRIVASGTVGSDDDDDPSGSVQFFDLVTGEALKTYPVGASTISSDGQWMASFDNSGTYHAVLWSLSDGSRAHDLTPQNPSRVLFRPDGQEVAVTHGNSNAIDFVSTATGAITKSLPGGGYGLETAAYSADGKLLAAGTYGAGTIKVWNLASMKEQVTLYGQSPVENIAFSPDGRLLASTSGELRVWNVANGTEVIMLTDAPVSRAVFSADGKWLAANPGEKFPGTTLKIWSTETWKEAGSFMEERGFPAFWFDFSSANSAPPKIGNAWSRQFKEGEQRTLWISSQAMAVSADGKWFADPEVARLPNGFVEICDAVSGEKLQTIPAHKLAVVKISFSRDGRWLLTVGQDNNPMMVQGHPGLWIANPRVSVWDTKTWNLEFSTTFSSTMGADAAISADGKLLAVSRGGAATLLFDLEQKKPIASLDSPDGRGGYMAISPDRTALVQVAQDGIRFWNLPAAKPISSSGSPVRVEHPF